MKIFQMRWWFPGRLTPTQPKVTFEGKVNVQTQQVHPARAVLDIFQSGAKMSFFLVAIGAAYGVPQCDPLWIGDHGKLRRGLYPKGEMPSEVRDKKWGGVGVVRTAMLANSSSAGQAGPNCLLEAQSTFGQDPRMKATSIK